MRIKLVYIKQCLARNNYENITILEKSYFMLFGYSLTSGALGLRSESSLNFFPHLLCSVFSFILSHSSSISKVPRVNAEKNVD